jgi:diguanylate cyclase (GGDEF)-like protein/PAS domain S-box-containing protein
MITTDANRFEALRRQMVGWLAPTEGLNLALEPSVARAQSYASSRQVDLVVLDVEDMTRDLAAVHRVIKLFAPVPVVAWLAEQDNGLSRELVAHGAAACLNDAMIVSGFLPQTFDIIVRGAKSLHVRDQKFAHMSVTLEAIADAVICTDSRAEITFTNSAARRLLGFPPDELVGCTVATVMTLQDHSSREPITHPVHQAISSMHIGRLVPGTILIRHDRSEIRIADCCSPIVDASGTLQGTVMVFHDITEVYEMRAHVDHLAFHDFLTGLPNRFAIQKRLDATLAHAAVHHQPVALLYLDLDKFKLVNDTLGHGVGDKLLVSVAERLCACFRLTDLVGRQGGDEFIVVMAPGSRPEDAILASARILEALGKPHTINGNDVRTGCSIGIAMYPEHANTADILMLHADVALQSVKAAGRNGGRMYSPELMADTLERQLMEKALRHTVEEKGFSLVYQPKVRLEDDTVCGCEALLRWHHPDWGWVPPTKFIPCAEACGLIDALGKWVLAEAIRQAQAWQKAGIDFGHIAINISAQELRHPGFIDHVRAELEASGIDPDTLQLELTESVLMHDVDDAGKVLGELKQLGLSVAIDDFGTGYSSLSYLNDLPIDVLKIDRSFIHGIHLADTRQQALLHAILSLAASLSLRVVVEGIETIEEKHYLHKNGCDIGQGYYFSEPLEAGRFEEFIRPGGIADKLVRTSSGLRSSDR